MAVQERRDAVNGCCMFCCETSKVPKVLMECMCFYILALYAFYVYRYIYIYNIHIDFDQREGTVALFGLDMHNTCICSRFGNVLVVILFKSSGVHGPV